MTNEEKRILKSLKSGVWGTAPKDDGYTIDDLVAMSKIRKQPPNKKQVGDEFVCKSNGNTYIKVAEPSVWKRKQIYVYEKAYGKIPKGYNVVLLNQNKNDYSLENLALVRKKDVLTCKNKNMFSSNKELTRLGLLTAKLINKVYERNGSFNETNNKN